MQHELGYRERAFAVLRSTASSNVVARTRPGNEQLLRNKFHGHHAPIHGMNRLGDLSTPGRTSSYLDCSSKKKKKQELGNFQRSGHRWEKK